jgi:hypothetical protein
LIKNDLGGGHQIFLQQDCKQENSEADWFGNINFSCDRSIRLLLYAPTNDPIIKGNLKGAIGIFIHGNKTIEALLYTGIGQPAIKIDHDPILKKYDLWDFVRSELNNVSMLKYSYNTFLGRWFR